MLPSTIGSSTRSEEHTSDLQSLTNVVFSLLLANVNSVRSRDASPSVPCLVCLFFRPPVNLALPPFPTRRSSDLGFTVIPATSLSLFVTDTSDAFRLL